MQKKIDTLTKTLDVQSDLMQSIAMSSSKQRTALIIDKNFVPPQMPMKTPANLEQLNRNLLEDQFLSQMVCTIKYYILAYTPGAGMLCYAFPQTCPHILVSLSRPPLHSPPPYLRLLLLSLPLLSPLTQISCKQPQSLLRALRTHKYTFTFIYIDLYYNFIIILYLLDTGALRKNVRTQFERSCPIHYGQFIRKKPDEAIHLDRNGSIECW